MCHIDKICSQSVKRVIVLEAFGLHPEFDALELVVALHASQSGIANNLHGEVAPTGRSHRP